MRETCSFLTYSFLDQETKVKMILVSWSSCKRNKTVSNLMKSKNRDKKISCTPIGSQPQSWQQYFMQGLMTDLLGWNRLLKGRKLIE